MKKLVFCLAVALMAFSVSSFAQPGGGYIERTVQLYKDSLPLTNVQADSITAILKEFMPQLAGASLDKSLSIDDRKAKLKAIGIQLQARYKTILSADQYAKLGAMQARINAQTRNRAPGGNYR